MRRRRYLAAGVGLVATLTGRLWGSADASRGIDIENETDDPEPITVDGTGATVTDTFDLEGGVTIAEAVHDGQGNVIVELLPQDGRVPELVVTERDGFEGETTFDADGGFVTVEAAGPWTLTLESL